MEVQDIFIYPVKSLGGIRCRQANALQRGFQYDRRLMLIDETGTFITQRIEHRLALLSTQVNESAVTIFHKQNPQEQLSIPLVTPTGTKLSVSIWDDRVSALSVSEEADEWFTRFLGRACKLVLMPEDGQRPVDVRYAEHEEHVSFADAFPFLLIGQGSLDDLNSRLDQPVPMNRFRPNLVVSGAAPFEEDSWARIQIGEVEFKVAKPCARCILTTVDQNTAIKGKEPLLTLSTYRKQNNKILFGQNLIALSEGIIRENDPVTILSRK